MAWWIRFSGIVGVVLFLFGILGGVILQSFAQVFVAVHLIIGALLVLLWFFAIGVRRIGEAGSVIRGRTVRFGTNAVLYVLVFAGILVAINWYVNRHDSRWDLTEAGVYSLSSQTEALIKGLKKPLKIAAISEGPNVDSEQIKDLFELYRYQNPGQVKIELINPRTKPQLIDLYGMKPGNLAYIAYGEGAAAGVSRVNDLTEEAITNAIIKLTRGEAKKVYIVQGHEEPSITSMDGQGLKLLADALNDEHLKAEGLMLSKSDKIPDDAAAVLLVSPKRPLLAQERELLKKYGDAGGRLILFADPMTTSDVKEIAAHFGITVGDDVVIDQIQRLFDAPALGAQPMVADYESHAITKNLSQETPTVFNIASSVQATGSGSATVTYSNLIKTGPSAWGEKSLDLVFSSSNPTARRDEGDLAGPVSLAAAYERNYSKESSQGSEQQDDKKGGDKGDFEKIARVVVFGDSDFILNQNLRVYFNRDLVLNAVNWSMGEEGGVSVRPKAMRASFAPIPRDTFLFILSSSFVLPELILVFGLFVWWRRRTAEA